MIVTKLNVVDIGNKQVTVVKKTWESVLTDLH